MPPRAVRAQAPSNPSRTNAHIHSQELKAHNKAAKIEMERARAADHAPNIPEFVPSLEAQQLPGLSQVVLGFWVVRELHDRKHASVAKHINPPCFVADGSVPHIGTFNQRYMRRQRFHNAMMSMFCGNRHAIPPPRRVGPAARLPTVGVDGAVQLEQPLPAQPQQAGARAAPLAAGRQQRKPNRCRQCGCEKCTATTKTCTQEHRHEWCTQNGWERHWRADADGQGNAGMSEGPRPSKSKLQQCVRCEVEQLQCWRRRADEL